jgi:hypothetical protein
MSDDIVWRLEGEGSPRALCGAPPLLIEAADEIKRLRAREALLLEALQNIFDMYGRTLRAGEIALAALGQETE